MGKTFKKSFKVKILQEISALGLNTIILKHGYWYMQQISVERLQDHWSSGLDTLGYTCSGIPIFLLLLQKIDYGYPQSMF